MSLRLRFLFDRLFRSGSPRIVTSPAPRFRPQLEAFEDRTVPATLSGNVWLDANANGTRDEGETAAAGVTVELYDFEAQFSPDFGERQTATTDANGNYTFTDLAGDWYALDFSTDPAGDPLYSVTVALSSATANTIADAGIAPALAELFDDSDASAITTVSASVWSAFGDLVAAGAGALDQFVLTAAAAQPGLTSGGSAYGSGQSGTGGGFGQTVQIGPGSPYAPQSNQELFFGLGWIEDLGDKPWEVVADIRNRTGPLTPNEDLILREIKLGKYDEFVLTGGTPQARAVMIALLKGAAAEKLASAGLIASFWSSPATFGATQTTLPQTNPSLGAPSYPGVFLFGQLIPSTMFGGTSGGTPAPIPAASLQQQLAPLLTALGAETIAERDEASNQIGQMLAGALVNRDRQAFLTIREALRATVAAQTDPEIVRRAARLLSYMKHLA
jgi:hypothetical protein